MPILLGWMWGPFARDRDVLAVADGFEGWDVRPAKAGGLPWRGDETDAAPVFGHFTAADVPAPSVARFSIEPLVDLLFRRLRPMQFDRHGRILMSFVTDETNAGLGVQLEVASSHVDVLTPALGEAFADTDMVLYSPSDDTLHSRGAMDTALLSSPSGHQWQPGWNDITLALQHIDDHAVLLFENQRGDYIRLIGTKATLAVACRIAGDPVEHAVASRGNDPLTLDDAFQLFKSFFEDGERSPWFSWRPAE